MGRSLHDDRHVTGKMRIKLGPITTEFDGNATFERDASTYSGKVRGSGRAARSSSATRGAISYRLVSGNDAHATRVDIDVGYTLTGMLAQFGRTDLTRDIVSRITKAFVQNLEARMAFAGTDRPATGGRAQCRGARFFHDLGTHEEMVQRAHRRTHGLTAKRSRLTKWTLPLTGILEDRE